MSLRTPPERSPAEPKAERLGEAEGFWFCLHFIVAQHLVVARLRTDVNPLLKHFFKFDVSNL